ncbi:zinc-dependent metalloprotease [Sediminitomix flava]|uniref:Putative secreted protein (Por secretion system target) n=1 Tax=Sediminitomix flava TaxID=379075 RepID=A0A315ZH94_SEDFL|nr:M43 family zinc metalloprotease [Sediminitomix flava]PWJ44559.1 putative secreted protein (Por secretion system target) [Sediminitomix flava]
MKISSSFLLTLLWGYTLFSISFLAEAQHADHRCVTYERDLAKRADFHMKSMSFFDRWVTVNKIAVRSSFRTQSESITSSNPLRLQVIFHIIHNGEVEGIGTNIRDDQVYSQLEAMNEDFHLRTAEAENIPDVFKDVATTIPIEFVPAAFDPNGNPLDELGINRVLSDQSSWSFNSLDQVLIPQIIWDTEKYLNVFVARFNNSDLGYAFYPTGTSIDDIDNVNHVFGSQFRDGLVMSYLALGSNFTSYGDRFDLYEDFEYGHTASHEVGHYLGLHHIWGYSDNSNCEPENDDFCEDTPSQSSSNLDIGSPCAFPGPDRCDDDDLPDMFMNFMDYSLDVCMSMFTLDQKERMFTVLENSPRRKTLGKGVPLADISLEVRVDERNERTILWSNNGETDEDTGYLVVRKRFNTEEVRYLTFMDRAEGVFVDSDFLERAEEYYYQVFAVNTSGYSKPSISIDATGSPITSSDDFYTPSLELIIGPNPSTGTVSLSGSVICIGKEFHFALYNTKGQLVLEKSVLPNSETVSLNLEHLPKGIYLLKTLSENSQVKRIVLQ